MQQQSVDQWKKSAVDGASATIHQFHDVAEETKREFGTIWRNADVREDLIRTGIICVAVFIGVAVLSAIASWLPLWLRLVVIFATIGILGRWLMTKIADGSD